MTRSIRIASLILLGFALFLSVRSAAAADEACPSAKKLHVAVLTGGHQFIEQDFSKLFQGYDDITYQHLSQKLGGEVFEDIAHWPYDVIVLYNMNQQLTPKQQKNFLKLLDKGVGLVHPASCDRRLRPVAPFRQDFRREISSRTLAGERRAARTLRLEGGGEYQGPHRRPGPSHHPRSGGLRSAGRDLLPLYRRPRRTRPADDRCTHQRQDNRLGEDLWQRRVFFMQSGHCRTAYENPNYRKIVVRAIRWAAGKD